MQDRKKSINIFWVHLKVFCLFLDGSVVKWQWVGCVEADIILTPRLNVIIEMKEVSEAYVIVFTYCRNVILQCDVGQ